MAKRWYVIHTYSGYENKVKADLEHRIETYGLSDQIVDIKIPTEEVTEIKEGGGWDLWRKIAAQDPSFGHPDKFCYDPELSNWMSATVTTLDQRIVPYIKKICKRDPFSGKVVTGGIVTVTPTGCSAGR